MKKAKFYVVILLIVISNSSSSYSKNFFIASTKPIAMILKEIIGTRGTVLTIMPDSSHPLNYKLKSKEILDSYSSSVIIYTSDELEPWVGDLPLDNKIALLDLLPAKNKIPLDRNKKDPNNKMYDPYFWTDPMTVKALLPFLADTIGKIFTEDAGTFSQNVTSFGAKLDLINRRTLKAIKENPKKPLIFIDCEMNYFIKQYNILNAGNYKSFTNIHDSVAISKLNIPSIKQSAPRSVVCNSHITPKNFNQFISFETGLHAYKINTFTDGKPNSNYGDLIDAITTIITNALK